MSTADSYGDELELGIQDSANSTINCNDYAYNTVDEIIDNVEHRNKISEFLKLNLFRITANAEWIGGVIGGAYLNKYLGDAAFATPVIVTSLVGGLEYGQTSMRTTQSSSVGAPTNRAIKEFIGLGMASWQGANVTVSYNSAAGLDNSKIRRGAQSLAYGAAVGLWSTPIPGFKQASEFTPVIIENAIQNPVKTVVASLLGSSILFSMNEGLRSFRKKRTVQLKS